MSTQRNILDRYLIHAAQAFYPKPAINNSCRWRPCGRLIRNISICKSLINYTRSDAVKWQAAGNTKTNKLSDYLTTILTVLSGRIQMLMTGTMLSVDVDWSRDLVGTTLSVIVINITPPTIILAISVVTIIIITWWLSARRREQGEWDNPFQPEGEVSQDAEVYFSLHLHFSFRCISLVFVFVPGWDWSAFESLFPSCCRWLCSYGREVDCARIVWRPTWRAQWPALRAASTAAALQALQPAPTTPLPPLLP